MVIFFLTEGLLNIKKINKKAAGINIKYLLLVSIFSRQLLFCDIICRNNNTVVANMQPQPR